MDQVVLIAFFAGVIAYSAATTLFFVDLARRARLPSIQRWSFRVLVLAALFHAVHLVGASVLTHVCPVSSVQFGLSLSALLAVLLYVAKLRRERLQALGAFIAPLALAFLVAAQFISLHAMTEPLPRAALAVHVTVNVVGLALFLLAGGASAFYLFVEGRIKSRRPLRSGLKLPPLDALDRSAHRLLLWGFPMLTLGIVTGAVFGHGSQAAAAEGAAVARNLLAYGAWSLLALVLLLRAVAGWRGRLAAYGTLAGVGCMLLVLAVYVGGINVGGGT